MIYGATELLATLVRAERSAPNAPAGPNPNELDSLDNTRTAGWSSIAAPRGGLRAEEPVGATLLGLTAPGALKPEDATLAIAQTEDLIIMQGSSSESRPETQTKIAPSIAIGRSLAHIRLTRLQPGMAQSSTTSPTQAQMARIALKLAERLKETPEIYAILGALRPADPDIDAKAGTIFSSSILNIGMIPGWPAPALRRAGEVMEMVTSSCPLDDLSQAQLLEFVVALGASPEIQTRLLNGADDESRRRRLLKAVIRLMVVVGGLISILRCEIEEIVSDFSLLLGGATPEAWAGRLRLLLK